MRKLTDCLIESNINIFAICITDTNENGILRMVIERPEELMEIFTLKNINYYLSKVVVVKIDTLWN